MFAAALIVFRESLEASLIISIMLAATRGMPGRGRWIVGGVLAGLTGAALVASSMEVISNMASGMGQELFSVGVLTIAVGMLAWHNIWMSVHGREMAAQAQNAARAVKDGTRAQSVIFIVVALAVLREGSETVLFLYSLATSGADGLRTTVSGGLTGLAGGALVGGLLYAGLLRVPLRWFFSVTGVFVLLLAASMASQVARLLIQADFLPSLGAPLWDTSAILSQSTPVGTVLHGLIGYDAQPAGMQIVFYVVVLIAISVGMRLARPKTPTRLT
ncbi:FTR1 family protein [Rhodoferax sp. PAMC 29310]|uniref:FTR1 family iron permease n=1 Tax=Rhodoferax sp. PAMC 29310 TaxID=2822760 RepID=UPI001B31B550|nr:FTR1 family protein [Rhodoferax sp. PAMC 29310]